MSGDKINKVSVGIVGLGTIATNVHIPVLSTFENVEIKSVAEIDAKRGHRIAKKWNIPEVYEDYNKMYENAGLDAVFICLPNFLHYDAVKSALENDLHVLCEKPMGLDANEAFELVKTAGKRGLILAVGYNRRLEKNYEEAAKIVNSFRLGRILQAFGVLVVPGPYAGWMPSSDWFFKDKYGVLYDSGSHMADLIMHVLSDRIIEVSALGISTMHGLDVLDNITCIFKTEKGAVGAFSAGWKTATIHDSIEVHGTGGSIFADSLEIEIRYGSYSPLERVAHHVGSARRIISSQVKRMGKGKRPSETYFKEDRAFINAVLGNGRPLVSGEDGLKVLKVLEAAKKSLEEKRQVKVEKHEA